MVVEKVLAGLRALIVEDEYIVADDLKRLLQRYGAYTVKLSGTIDDALAQIEKDGFEFALLDINIRGNMAFILADALFDVQVPFAFVSGYNRSVIPERFSTVPNWGKPYSDRDIIAGIQSLWTKPVIA